MIFDAHAGARRSSAKRQASPSLPLTIGFGLATLYLCGTLFRLGYQEWTLAEQSRLLQAERLAVSAQHKMLREQIAMCKTNAGIERLARQELGLVMAAEIPIRTVAAKEPSAHQAPKTVLPPAIAAIADYLSPIWR